MASTYAGSWTRRIATRVAGPKRIPRRRSRLSYAVERQEVEWIRMTLVGRVRNVLDDEPVGAVEVEIGITADIRIDLREVDAIGHREELPEHLGPAEDDHFRRVTRESERLLGGSRGENALRMECRVACEHDIR